MRPRPPPSAEANHFSEYTLLIAKRDPGQAIVWTAFLSLIAGLTMTFDLPRRHVWARLVVARAATMGPTVGGPGSAST